MVMVISVPTETILLMTGSVLKSRRKRSLQLLIPCAPYFN